ncbi:MAG: hypothetical protein HON42_05155 [Alphaproteobacteria bacterium]|jgi:zinc transport system permease protein|nr:hypothetical protein [Alphaproteobacteria bacterium]MBT5827677.1 hypothetical protein [Alphaproteobacteria bacterium]
MLEDFLVRTIIAGFLLSLVAGPIGSLIMWQKKAYFGDSLAHAAILGIAISLFLGINLNFAIIFVLISFATILIFLEKQDTIPSDTILGILAHSSLAFGMVLISFKQNLYFDLEGFLFGNILSVSKQDILLMSIVTIVIMCLLKLFWSKLILISLSQTLAEAELGKNMHRIKAGFALILAIFVALNIKIAGILLINSMLIISAATARQFANSALQVALIGSFIALLAVASGIISSYYIDIPTGATIVASLTILFIFSLYYKLIIKLFK